MKKFFNSLHIRLVALIFLVTLPSAVLLSIQTIEQRNAMIEHARQQALHTVDLLVSDQKKLIDNTRRFLQRLATFPEVQKPDSAECGRLIERALKLNSDYINLGVPRVDGELLCNAHPLKKRVNVADRAYIRTFATKNFSIGEFQLDRAADVTSVNFAYPVINPENDTLVGAVVAVVSLDWWSKRLNESYLPKNSIAYITDSENTIIAHFPTDKQQLGGKKKEWKVDTSNIEILANHKIIKTKNRDGVDHIYVEKHLLQTSSENEITVIVGIPFSQTLDALQTQFIWRIGLLALFIVMLFALANYGIKASVLKPIRNLSRLVQSPVNDGVVEKTLGSRDNELIDIGKKFSRMATILQESQKIAHLGSFEYIAATQQTVWSDEECRIYGLDPAQSSPDYQDMLENFIHPDDAKLLDETFKNAFANAEVYELEHKIIRPDGTVRIVYDIARPYLDNDGNVYKYIGTTQDITERKQAELALQKSENRFRTVFNQQFQFMAILSEQGRTLEINDLALQKQGLTAEDYVGKLFWESPVWRDLPEWKKIWKQRLEQTRLMQEPLLTEDVYQAADGSLRYADTSTLALRTSEGEVSGFLIQATDTTERQQASAKARDTDSVLNSVFNLLNDLFFLLEQDGTIVDYRARNDADLYISPDQFLGKPIQDVLPPEVGSLFVEKLQQTTAGTETSFEYALTFDGKERFYDARLAKLPEVERHIMVVRDITARKLDELENNDQVEELRRWHEVTMGREGRVLELKQEINRLSVELGRPSPYLSVEGVKEDDE